MLDQPIEVLGPPELSMVAGTLARRLTAAVADDSLHVVPVPQDRDTP